MQTGAFIHSSVQVINITLRAISSGQPSVALHPNNTKPLQVSSSEDLGDKAVASNVI